MEILILIAAMVVVGLIMTFVSKLIWKDELPVSMNAAYIIGVVTAVVVGLADWFVIPAMGFSDTVKYVGAALEPAASVPLVLWVIKKAKS
ncbi:MAG: hypothetical protein KAI06_06550 [Anaerolineales bacterium]|nr:hypothetical protein [Anaerolineales bacterium]